MIILRQREYSENSLYELDYNELCRMYPKLKDLKFFIDNASKLNDIEFYLDKYRIVVDYFGLSCDLCDGIDEYTNEQIREELNSDNWIICIGGGELSYNTKDNKFYQIDLFSRNAIRIEKPITVENYKKELYKNIVSWCKDSIKKYKKDYPKYEEEVNKYILQPLKKIFKL